MTALAEFDAAMDDVQSRIQAMTAEANAAVPGWDGQERRAIEVTEHVGVEELQLGNDGIDIGAWIGAPASTDSAALPGTEHRMGVEWESLPKPKWLTENRSFAIAGALAVVGIYLGVLS